MIDIRAGTYPQTQSVIIPDSGPFQAGGLSQHVQDWQDITTDYVSLQAIRGVEIPIWKMPPLLPPSRRELERRTVDPVVDQNISEMLDLGAIREVPRESEVFVSKVFTVPKVERGKEYGRRFILNLKVRIQICLIRDTQEPLHFSLFSILLHTSQRS